MLSSPDYKRSRDGCNESIVSLRFTSATSTQQDEWITYNWSSRRCSWRMVTRSTSKTLMWVFVTRPGHMIGLRRTRIAHIGQLSLSSSRSWTFGGLWLKLIVPESPNLVTCKVHSEDIEFLKSINWKNIWVKVAWVSSNVWFYSVYVCANILFLGL